MELVGNVWKFLLSPKLYRSSGNGLYSGMYRPNNLEKWGDTVILASWVLYHTAFYTVPVLSYIAYQRGYFTGDGLLHLMKIGYFAFAFVAVHCLIRSIGRATNPAYVSFYNTYSSVLSNYNSQTKRYLQNYEFDFSSWPIDFDYNSVQQASTIECRQSVFTTLGKVFSSPQSLIGFIALRAVAIKIMYPGSISALNYVIQPTLQSGRKKLFEEYRGERFKLRTPDNNELDTMFVDRRNYTTNGSTLIICTEGNAGFYEIGIMVTPLELGYSVLGWNHPGFGSSSGTPFIEAEKCAVETVMQFAFQQLNFTPENVILFGWSIGGFCSSFASSIYTDMRAVVLDATFDDILPLAKKQMPSIVENIVEITIRKHADLNIAENLKKYPGLIRLVRRTEDEIIALSQGDVSTNRGNDLLVKLLRHRYPEVCVNETEPTLWAWLSTSGPKQDSLYEKLNINEDIFKQEYKKAVGRSYPCTLGKDWDIDKKTKMLLYIANMYYKDFPSTHCTSLPSSVCEAILSNL